MKKQLADYDEDDRQEYGKVYNDILKEEAKKQLAPPHQNFLIGSHTTLERSTHANNIDIDIDIG